MDPSAWGARLRDCQCVSCGRVCVRAMVTWTDATAAAAATMQLRVGGSWEWSADGRSAVVCFAHHSTPLAAAALRRLQAGHANHVAQPSVTQRAHTRVQTGPQMSGQMDAADGDKQKADTAERRQTQTKSDAPTTVPPPAAAAAPDAHDSSRNLALRVQLMKMR
jgi:hypothetical protein